MKHMEIRNLDMYPMRKIIRREYHMPASGNIWGRDQGNVTLILECGHRLLKKHSQTKHKGAMRCRECGYKPSPPSQEHGPRRFVQPLRRQSQPQQEESLD